MSSVNSTLQEKLRAADEQQRGGRVGDAIRNWREVLAVQPENVTALAGLAVALQSLGEHAESAALFARLLPQAVHSFEIQARYGQVLQALGQYDAAIGRYRCALALQPGFEPIWRTMGALLLLQGHPAEAEAALRRALQLQPDSSETLNNLGVLLREQERHADAVPMFRRALALQAHAPQTLRNLADSLLALAVNAEAESLYLQLLKVEPDDPVLLNNLAAALNGQRKYADAEAVLRKALAAQPGNAAVHANLGQALINQGRYRDAEPAFRDALRINPADALVASNLGIALLNTGRHADAGQVIAPFLTMQAASLPACSAMLYTLLGTADCSPEAYLSAARRYGVAATAKATPYTQWHMPLLASEQGCLRVGLVSGDLRTHPVGYFLENFIRHLDPQRVQLVAYSTRAQEDALTARLKPHFAEWHDISLLDDAQAARKIHADGIHVLVDLAGHTTHNRLPVFAWKPAPVQVSWLGYSASTGLPAIDWLIVDGVSAPPEAGSLYSEGLWYLPTSRVCFTPPADAPPCTPLPAQQRRSVTFGSFQGASKLGDNVLDLWARVLDAVPQSRLRLQNGEMSSAEARTAFLQRAAARGIDPARVVTAGRVPRDEYLAAHAEVDVILDTFPYPGGTTTCEALWMGVPTLTLCGRTLLSRYGASVLDACGLQAWIAYSEDDYVRLAAAHAADIDALSALRAVLRTQTAASSLCDGAAFARHFADAMHGMWRERLGR